jgi:hypothetical protein
MGADVAHDVARSVRDIAGWSMDEADARAEAYRAKLRHSYNLRV